MDHKLFLYNTLLKSKELFQPIDEQHIKMYVCGPTVYSHPHIGNVRSAVVYDVLYRLLRHLYSNVTYVRNITDIDDKVIKAVEEGNSSVLELTTHYSEVFNEDLDKLFCLYPTIAPKATDNISEMIEMIEKLITYGNAYVIDGSVYFRIASYFDYGKLSGNVPNQSLRRVRIEINTEKSYEGDFVLWKPDEKFGWDSPWGMGRPGWHIECSAMSTKYLGSNFDIHGGGMDLQFPHHENEIAQSCCAFPGSSFAKYWVHNGFLTVDNDKMSKSKGNTVVLHDLLQKYDGEVIRYVLLGAHYHKPLDWNQSTIDNAIEALNRFYHVIDQYERVLPLEHLSESFLEVILNDMNTPQALSLLHEMATEINSMVKSDAKYEAVGLFKANCIFLGLLNYSANQWLRGEKSNDVAIERLIKQRAQAKVGNNYKEADEVRKKLTDMGVIMQDHRDGSTTWYMKK